MRGSLLKVFFALIILIGVLKMVNAQDGQPFYLLESSNIIKIETYFFEPNATQDSTLVTKEEYNNKGRRTKIEIYDSLGLANHYEYDYLFDTIRTERRTYCRNELSSITILEYNQYGKEIRATDYDADGIKLELNSEHIYNDQQRLIEMIIYKDDSIWVHEKMKYHDNGKLSMRETVKPEYRKNTSLYDNNGELKHNQDSKNYRNEEVFENYKSTGKKMFQVDERKAYRTGVIGVKGVLRLKSFDFLRSQTYYKVDGLIDFELQYVNGHLIGKRKYKYFR